MNSFETLIIYCIVSLGGADEETEEENYSSDDTEKFNTVIDTHKLQQLLNGPSAAQVQAHGKSTFLLSINSVTTRENENNCMLNGPSAAQVHQAQAQAHGEYQRNKCVNFE